MKRGDIKQHYLGDDQTMCGKLGTSLRCIKFGGKMYEEGSKVISNY